MNYISFKKKAFFLTILLMTGFISVNLLSAMEVDKKPVKIEFEITNYPSDTMLLGYYYGNRTLVLDTLYSKEKGSFTFESDTLLPSGVYLALFQPGNSYFQFMINEYDQKFKLNGDFNGAVLVPSGSEDNELFYSYMDFITQKSKLRQEIQEEIDDARSKGKSTENLDKKLSKLDLEVSEKQDRVIKKYPNTITSRLLKSNLASPIPEFQGTSDEISMKRYLFYKSHYFENIDLGDPTILRTPFLDERVLYYIEKLTPNHPDSIFESINYLLGKMEPAPETFQFYTSTFLNKYANSKIIGYDGIYVKLVDHYYGAGKTPWVSEENLKKFKENADKLKPILIGKQAPPITFYKENGDPVALYDIESRYTIMIFWAPDCGHCKKAMPGLKEFYAKFKPQGVEVLGICTKHRDKFKTCWEYSNEQELPWITVGDQYHRSNFRDIYNVVSTPRVFILDENKQIILKRVPTEKLGEIMEALIQEAEENELKKQNEMKQK